MDDPGLDSAKHQKALAGLARTHRVTMTARQLWKSILDLGSGLPTGPIAILDAGCGDGFILQQIHALARSYNRRVSLIGCDFSETAIKLARRSADRKQIQIEFHECDVLTDDLPPADIVISTLLLHHFNNRQVVDILTRFDAAAKTAVIIQDLVRTRLGYVLCLVGTRILSRSPIVHVDGLLSVKAAFSFEEMEQIVRRAGIDHARIFRQWPERISIVWSTNEGQRP